MENKKFHIRQINEIGKVGLKKKEDIVLIFRELLYSYPEAKWEPEDDVLGNEMCDLLTLLESQTDHLLKGTDFKNLSLDLQSEQNKDEKRVLDFYKEDIKELFTYLSKVDF